MRQLNSLEENALKISKYSTIAFIIFFFFFIGFVAESVRPLYILGGLILIVWKYIAKVNILTFSNREMAVKDFEKYKNLEHESGKR